MKCRDTWPQECRNVETQFKGKINKVHPTVQINLKEIGGLLLHDTVKLLETIDGFYQRMRRDFGVISRGAEESHGICQWNEDDSWRKLTAG
jgi:hypothetical protein